jgi:hypothetical protein
MRATAVLLVVLVACGGESGPKAEPAAPIPEPPADAISSVTEASGGRVTTRVWPAKPTLGDSIWMQIEVEAEAGVPVDLSFDEAAVGRFAVTRYVPEAQRATYELAAPMSGRHRIPPVRLRVGDEEVFTEEIPLEVATVLAEKTDQALRPARQPLPVRVGGGFWWPALAIGGFAVGAGVGVFTWLRLRSRAVRRRQVSAWELALRRLADLEAGVPDDDPVGLDAWYVALSDVVRVYLEGRFQLRAPELTTEEFLAVARRTPDLGESHRDLLGSFLERCDQVKFAGWRPGSTESLEVLGAARSFVADTRPAEAR